MLDGSHSDVPRPLNEREFRMFMNKVGEVTRPRELRLSVYQTGAEPAVRKVLWKHLLGVYPQGKLSIIHFDNGHFPKFEETHSKFKS
jgi:hypothetical protein